MEQRNIVDSAAVPAAALADRVASYSKPGETAMGESGKKDKGKREQQKKPQLSLKEKRAAKRDKKNKQG